MYFVYVVYLYACGVLCVFITFSSVRAKVMTKDNHSCNSRSIRLPGRRPTSFRCSLRCSFLDTSFFGGNEGVCICVLSVGFVDSGVNGEHTGSFCHW